jgi:hypothetical protein
MTPHNIPLGRILGIPIGLDYSWFVIFALLTWMLADSYYPAECKNWPWLLYWFVGAATAIMLFVSVLLHARKDGSSRCGRTEWFKDHKHGPEMVVVPAGKFLAAFSV